MANPHAVIANWRVVGEYSISNLAHKVRVYVQNVQLSGGVYSFRQRGTDLYTITASAGINRLMQQVTNMCDNTIVVGVCRLEQRSGNVWNPVYAITPTVTPTANTFLYPATQLTVTLWDENLNRFKVTLMEPYQAAPQHSLSATGGNTGMDAWVRSLTYGDGNADDPANWMCSKYQRAPLNTGFIAFTVTLNKKLRRARGYL